jgi:hypothetical protein
MEGQGRRNIRIGRVKMNIPCLQRHTHKGVSHTYNGQFSTDSCFGKKDTMFQKLVPIPSRRKTEILRNISAVSIRWSLTFCKYIYIEFPWAG